MSEGITQSNRDVQGGVLDYLQTAAPDSDNWSIEVIKGDRSGILHLRKQDIIAAQCGPLHGNGALLTIAGWKDPQIRQVIGKPEVKRNTSLALADIHKELSLHPPLQQTVSFDEIANLKQAILMVYQFQYREAGAKLAEILRYNRYNYIAWFWYSRIVGKTETILKTLNEAQKWGNCDQEILAENKRNRGLLVTTAPPPPTVKHCPFCWTVLRDQPSRCSYCKTLLKIGEGAVEKPTKLDQLDTALTRFQRVHKLDPNNAQVAYCIALGYFNINRIEQAIGFLRIAARNAPGVAVYVQNIALLESLLQQKSPAQAAPESKRPVVPISAPKANQKSILVIEDSQTSRKVISMVLTREGYHVVEACNGLDGVRMGRETQPSLILLDVMLPDMTGYDVLPRLKEMPHLKNVPAIMLTGKTSSTDRVLGMRAGSDEYLTKPFNPQKLVGIIKKYL